MFFLTSKAENGATQFLLFGEDGEVELRQGKTLASAKVVGQFKAAPEEGALAAGWVGGIPKSKTRFQDS